MAGTVDRVWHRPEWLWPLFWALGCVRILFPDTGQRIPATLRIIASRDAAGSVRHTWRRTFGFRRPRHFDATLSYDPTLDRVVERVGLGGMLEVVWNIGLIAPGAMGIVTEGMALRLGRRRLWLPRLLHVDVWAIEQAAAARDDTVHLDLWMTHPLVGALFGYEGTFRLRRCRASDVMATAGGADGAERIQSIPWREREAGA